MMTSYLYFAGTEIANHERLMAYMSGNVALGYPALRAPNTSVNPNCFCDTAHPLFCDQGAGVDGAYTSPANDPAPWYDADDAASGEFAGFFIEDITGFDGTVARDMAEGAISGTSLGPLRLKGRCLTFTGWLRAKSCCGAEFGLRWLQEALLGNNSCNNCALSDLYMIKCCPPEDDTCHIENVSESNLVTTESLLVTVTDNGGGLYTIVLDDSTQNNVISVEADGPNNFNGYVLTAYTAAQIWRLGLTPTVGSNAVNILTVPPGSVTGLVTAASGTGASATIDVNTLAVSTCEDEQALIDALATTLATFVTTYGSGVATALFPVGLGRITEIVDGIDPIDYVRLLHRVGLTDGVKVIEKHGNCCSSCGCTNLKVQFTLCSELPYIYSDISWCVEDEPFPVDQYCLNLKKICGTCGTPTVGTTQYERQVPRPTCGVILRHDQSWCTDGWDIADGCPPEDCILTISGTTEFVPSTDLSTCAAGGESSGTDTCTVTLADDGTWTETGGAWAVADGFPPPYCTLEIDGGGTCNEGDPPPDPPEEPCLIRLIYDECTGLKTWEPLRWSGDVPFPVDCPCVEIAETCLIVCDASTEDCPDPQECPVLINCFGAWTPVGWVHDPEAPFPDPNCTYVVANEQVTTDLTEIVEIPSDIFVPDCGPLPISPPAPFLISTNCFCDPWVTRRLCCTFTNSGDWNDATSYIEIYTGSSEMRRLKIEAYQNPFGEAVPCPCDPNDPFWECRTPCASILVPQLPQGSRLVIDSRLHTAQLVLPGGNSVSAMRYIFAEDGAPFGWFDIGQCSTFCIVASVDAQFVADDATLSIGMVTRYLASGG